SALKAARSGSCSRIHRPGPPDTKRKCCQCLAPSPARTEARGEPRTASQPIIRSASWHSPAPLSWSFSLAFFALQRVRPALVKFSTRERANTDWLGGAGSGDAASIAFTRDCCHSGLLSQSRSVTSRTSPSRDWRTCTRQWNKVELSELRAPPDSPSAAASQWLAPLGAL